MATTRPARTSVHANEALVTATSLRLDIICAYLGWFCGDRMMLLGYRNLGAKHDLSQCDEHEGAAEWIQEVKRIP
jgi:hypothetical protein